MRFIPLSYPALTRPLLVCCLLILSAQCRLQAAAPANDNFASRVNLGSSATASATGTNVDATMESGEDDYGDIAGASVWYEWTAPSTGWVTVYTFGSELDTVVGVYTGNTLPTLTRVGFNDGDIQVVGFSYPTEFDPIAGNHPSRLYFRAQAGTSYKISIAGWIFESDPPDMNSFSLNIEYETPEGVVNTLAMTPDPVDVTASSQTVTITFQADVLHPNDPGSIATIKLHPPGVTDANAFNSPSPSAFVTDLDLIAGTATSGTYETTVTIPRYAVPGNWSVKTHLFSQTGLVWPHGPGSDLMEDHVVPASGYDTFISVVNNGPSDSSGPVLQTFSVNPVSADVTSSDQEITITMRITDDVSGLGENGRSVALRSENMAVVGSFLIPRISGTALDGIYEATLLIPAGFPSGNHYWGVELYDEIGNRRAYSIHPDLFDGPFPAGISPTYSVNGSTRYAAWAYGNYFDFPPQDAPLDDPNNDGTANLACYAFGLLPFFETARVMTSGDSTGLPLIETVGTGATQRLRIEFVRRKASSNSGLTYRPQFGDTLAESGPGSFSDAAGTPVITNIDNVWERVVIEDTVTGASSRFGRVKVDYSPPP